MNPFRSLNFKLEKVQTQVIEIYVCTFKSGDEKAKEDLCKELFCQLFECYNFDFNAFCTKFSLSKPQMISFLSYLLKGIYYHEIPLSNLKIEFLNEYLLVLLAESLPFNQVKSFILTCSKKEQLRLIYYCFKYPREGSWIVLEWLHSIKSDWANLLKLLQTKYYSLETLSQLLIQENLHCQNLLSILEKDAEQQVKWIKDFNILPKTYSLDELKSFFKIFGLYGYYIEIIHENSIYEILQKMAESQKNPQLQQLSCYTVLVSFFEEIAQELETFHHHPNDYLEGLQNLAYVLPTRGVHLPHQPWLTSVVIGLKQLITYLHQKGFKQVNADDYPIIVFDQADEEQFNKNEKYIKKLAFQNQVAIFHISKNTALDLAKRLNLKDWIETNDHAFGFGGSRNCAFFLGPVIFEAKRKGYKTINSILKLKRSQLQMYFKQAVLGQNGHDIMLHMGEDDVYIPPNHSFLNASFAYRHRHLFISRPVYCIGRATHEVNPLVDLDTVYNKPSSAYFSFHWNPFPISGRMKGMVTKPKFCLPTPFGNEELHVIPTYYVAKYFHQPILHLGGTRFPRKKFPLSPLDGMTEHLRSYLPYAVQISMCASLTDPLNKYKRSIFPWNQGHSFKSLGELWAYAAKPRTLKILKQRFLRNLKLVQADDQDLFRQCIQRLQTVDDALEIPVTLKKYYLKVQKETEEMNKLWNDLISSKRGSQKLPKNSLGNNLLILNNCIRSLEEKDFKINTNTI